MYSLELKTHASELGSGRINLCILVCVETNVNELSSFSLKQDRKAMHLQTFA